MLSVATIKRSYKDVAEFDQQARGYLARRDAKWRQENPESKVDPPTSKFVYAINRMLKRSQSILNDYREKVEDLNIKYCSEDEKGNVETDERGQFKFKRDELISRNKDQRVLFKTQTEIEAYHATEVPDDLTQEEKDIFAGFVMPEEPEKETS